MFNTAKNVSAIDWLTDRVGRKLRFELARSGLSLIEIMIALTMTLIVLGAMMTAFQSVSGRMQQGRAMIELANRVRNVESTLRADLTSMTVEPRPYTTTVPPGYFQIVEGPRRDLTMAASVNNVIGDVDDALSMTIQSKSKLFRGRFVDGSGTPQILESPIAEVSWFTIWNDRNGNSIPEFEDSIELRRRVLLVLPSITLPVPQAGYWNWNQVRSFFLNNDISVRIEPIPDQVDRFLLVPNQLTDLAIRKNRFGHLPAAVSGNRGAFLTWPVPGDLPVPVFVNAFESPLGFPNQMNYQMLAALSSSADIVLTDVTAFDVRVYSPNAPIWRDTALVTDASMVIEPGDMNQVTAGTPHGPFGAFIDLNGDPTGLGNGWFGGPSALRSQLTNANSTWPGLLAGENTYDTWTPAYESDGIDQDYSGANSIIDQGTDGLDNDGINGVDDIGERETNPPYFHPIRGIEIRIRTVERVTKQVHQVSIIQSFVPE
jgi:hypothetical protein